MAEAIYLMCALTALACCILLLRSYGRTKARLLFWGGLCFAGMFINNVVLVFDRVILPSVNLTTLRLATALIALLPLLYGLIWEDE